MQTRSEETSRIGLETGTVYYVFKTSSTYFISRFCLDRITLVFSSQYSITNHMFKMAISLFLDRQMLLGENLLKA